MNALRPILAAAAVLLLLPLSAVAAPAPGAMATRWLQGDEAIDGSSRQAAPTRDIRVQLWHGDGDEETYRRGERLRVHFRTNEDLHVVVYRIDADGYVEVLWPTSRYDDGFAYGGHSYTIPPQGSPRDLRVSSSKGVEYIQAIASRYPFDLRDIDIDFAFDPDEDGEYQHAVSGDPFLAVNDINFAITGLEDDSEIVVTDFAHVYVDEPVDYPRYACQQCHDGGESYRPYADTCTKVKVYSDFGWHRNWYTSFGWYPLYYEPPFYYYDTVLYRPYYNPYYPVLYRWPSYRVYSRPYPLYCWWDSPNYRGDYLTRYKSGRSRSGPLYDVASPSVARHLRDQDRRTRLSQPRSIDRAGRDGPRVGEDRLIRDRAPDRPRRELATRDGYERDRGRPGVRVDERRATGSDDRRSLRQTDDRRGQKTGRNWTRPVVRNPEPRRDRKRDPVPRVDRKKPERRDGKVDRKRPERRDPKVDRKKPERREPKVDRKPPQRREPKVDRKPPQRRAPKADRKPPQRRAPKADRKPPQRRESRAQRPASKRSTRKSSSRDRRGGGG